MSFKMTVTFKDGRRRVLKSPDDFKTIDKNVRRCSLWMTGMYIPVIRTAKSTKKAILAYSGPFMVLHCLSTGCSDGAMKP